MRYLATLLFLAFLAGCTSGPMMSLKIDKTDVLMLSSADDPSPSYACEIENVSDDDSDLVVSLSTPDGLSDAWMAFVFCPLGATMNVNAGDGSMHIAPGEKCFTIVNFMYRDTDTGDNQIGDSWQLDIRSNDPDKESTKVTYTVVERPPNPNACDTTADCPSDRACTTGVCLPIECETTSDCLTNEVCNNQRCDPDECDVDMDCGNARICEGHKCEQPECLRNADCDGGPQYWCNNLRCTAEFCTRQTCPDGRTCNETTHACEDP